MSDLSTAVPAIDGWFTTTDPPELLGTKCADCGTVFFPRAEGFCRNPACFGSDLTETTLSRRGTVWSYTDAQYAPPPPYIAADPYVPFAIAAVELAEEQIVVLGQVAEGYTVADLDVGTEVELVLETLYTDAEGTPRTIYRWSPA